jgi:signal transduction histidine kinase
MLTKNLLENIIPKARSKFIPAISEAIGGMLHEVFENTDEHATTDLANNALKKSIRGFFLRRHWLVEDTISELTADFPALEEFCKSIPPEEGSKRRQLIEISVFDSGPGLAQRVTKRTLSGMPIPAEFAAVQSCFREGVSTKLRQGHGIGLHYVLELLQQEKGFIRVRTGRLSLYGDLSSVQAEDGRFELSLRDASGQEPQRMGRVQGTLITILIPLLKQ